MGLQLRKRLHGGKGDNGERMSITGWALLFHPDLLHGFPIERHIGSYSFFDYRVNEALHMTDEEHDIMVSGIRQATISAGSSSSLPRTGLLPESPPHRYRTGSASNTPSISAACSKNQKVSLRRNTANQCSSESVTLTSPSPNAAFSSVCETLSIFPKRVKFHELVS